MMKRWMSMGMALCLTAASLAGCSGTKDAAESTQAEAETSAEEAAAEEETAKESDLDKLTFTYVTSPLNVPTIIEKNQGIFEKTFGDMGIEVDYAELTSGADQTQALASGDVQVLYAVGGTSVILSAANGADIKVLNMYSRSPKAFCMYSKDESLTTPESLRGKTIAGPTGTNLHELLVSYLATAGMTIDDVNYVNMSIPDAKAGLDGGSVDVALVAGATAYNAGKQGYHLVADGEGLIKAIIAVAVTQKFYDEHPEIIEKLEEAQTEIADFMEEKPDETMAGTFTRSEALSRTSSAPTVFPPGNSRCWHTNSRPSTTPGKKKAPNLSSCVLPIKKAYAANSSRMASPHRTELPAAVNCSIIWKYTQMSQLSIHTRSSKTAGTISGISKPTPTGTMLPDFSSPGRSSMPLAAPPRRSRTSLSPMSHAIRAIWQTCSTCQNPCATIPKQMYPVTETM